MASDSEASCVGDPNFAVICSFLEKFGTQCGITSPDFLELQEMLENTQELSMYLVDLHVKLLRKVKKSVTADRWERVLIKLCHTYCSQDAWELERFGYKKSRLSSKLRILKQLLEMQFDYNQKFKVEINKLTSTELRTEPIGRDKHGHSYWYQIDDHCEMRVYREDPDEETWVLVAKDREGLVNLITQLSSGDPSLGELTLNEDSNTNSLEIEKPITDTGQTSSSLEIDESSVGNEDSKESIADPIQKDSSSSNEQIITSAVVLPPEKSDAPSDLKITISTRQTHNKIETAIILPKEEFNSANEIPQIQPSIIPEVGMDLSLPQSISQLLPTRIVDLSSKKKKSINELAANLRFKTQDQLSNKNPVQEQEIDLSMKKNAMDPKQFSSLSVPPFEPISIESALQMSTDFPESEEELDEEEEEEDEDEEAEDEEEDDDDEELDESDEINLPSHMMKRPRLDRPTLLGNRKKKYSDEEEDDDEEYGDEIEEPVMLIRGEGSGRECDNENLSKVDDVGEAIEEEMMFFYGEGSGNDCKTGNTKKDEGASKKQDKASSSNVNSNETSERNRAATMKDINEGMGKTISTNVKSVGSTLISGNTNIDSDVKSESPNETTKPNKVGKIVIDIKSPQASHTPSPIKKSRWDVGRPVDPHIFATPENVPQKSDAKKLDSKVTAMSTNISIKQLKNEIPDKKPLATAEIETSCLVNNVNVAEITSSLINKPCSSQLLLLKKDSDLTPKGNVQDLVSKWEQVSDDPNATKNNPIETKIDENAKQNHTELYSTTPKKPTMFFFGPGCLKINTPPTEVKCTTLESDKEINCEIINKEKIIDENCSEIVPKNKADKSINNLINETKIKTNPSTVKTDLFEKEDSKNKQIEDTSCKEKSDASNEEISAALVSQSKISVMDKDKTQIIEILPILTNKDTGAISISKRDIQNEPTSSKNSCGENISTVVDIVDKKSRENLDKSKIVSTNEATDTLLKPDVNIDIKEKCTMETEKATENLKTDELLSEPIISVKVESSNVEDNQHHYKYSENKQVVHECERPIENVETCIKEISCTKGVGENKIDKALDVTKNSKTVSLATDTNVVEKPETSVKESSVLIEEVIGKEVTSEAAEEFQKQVSVNESKIKTITPAKVSELASTKDVNKIIDEVIDDTRMETNFTKENVASVVTPLESSRKTLTTEEEETKLTKPLNVAKSKSLIDTEENLEVCTNIKQVVNAETTEEDDAPDIIQENVLGLKEEESLISQIQPEIGANETKIEEQKSFETVHISESISAEKQKIESLEKIGSNIDEPDRISIANIDDTKRQDIPVKAEPTIDNSYSSTVKTTENENAIKKKTISLPISEEMSSTAIKLSEKLVEEIMISEKKAIEVEPELSSTSDILSDAENDKTVDELIDELQTEIKTTDEYFVIPKKETASKNKTELTEENEIIDGSIEETKMDTEDRSTKEYISSSEDALLETSEPQPEVTIIKPEVSTETESTNDFVDETSTKIEKAETSVVESEETAAEKSNDHMSMQLITQNSEDIISVTESKTIVDASPEEKIIVVNKSQTDEPTPFLKCEEQSKELKKEEEPEIIEKVTCEQNTESLGSMDTSERSSTEVVNQPVTEVLEEKLNESELLKQQSEELLKGEESQIIESVTSERRTENLKTSIMSTTVVVKPMTEVLENKLNDPECLEKSFQDINTNDSMPKDIVPDPQPSISEPIVTHTSLLIEESQHSQDNKNYDKNIESKSTPELQPEEREIRIISIEEDPSSQVNKVEDLSIEAKLEKTKIEDSSIVNSQPLLKDTNTDVVIDAESTEESKSEDKDIIVSAIDESQPSQKDITKSIENKCDEIVTLVSSVEETRYMQKANNNINTGTSLTTGSKIEEVGILPAVANPSSQGSRIEESTIELASTIESKSEEVNQISIAESQFLLDDNVQLIAGPAIEIKSKEETRIFSIDQIQASHEDDERINIKTKSTTDIKEEKYENSTTEVQPVSEDKQVDLNVELSSSGENNQASPEDKKDHNTIETKSATDTKSEEDENSITADVDSQPLSDDKQDINVELLSGANHSAETIKSIKDDTLLLNDNPEMHVEQTIDKNTTELSTDANQINIESGKIDESNIRENIDDTVVVVQSETKTVEDKPVTESSDTSNTVEKMNIIIVANVLKPDTDKVLPGSQECIADINTIDIKLSEAAKNDLLDKVKPLISKTMEEIAPSSVVDISQNISISDDHKDRKKLPCLEENTTIININDNSAKESVHIHEYSTESKDMHVEKLTQSALIVSEKQTISNTIEDVTKESVAAHTNSEEIKCIDDKNSRNIVEKPTGDRSISKNIKDDNQENTNEIVYAVDKKEIDGTLNITASEKKVQIKEFASKEKNKIHESNDKLETSKCKDSEIAKADAIEFNPMGKHVDLVEVKEAELVTEEPENLIKIPSDKNIKPVIEEEKTCKQKSDESLNSSSKQDANSGMFEKNDFKGFDLNESKLVSNALEPKQGLIKVKAFAIEQYTKVINENVSCDSRVDTHKLFPDNILSKNPLEKINILKAKEAINDDIENEFSSDDDMGGCLVEFDDSDQSEIEEITAPLIVKGKESPNKITDEIDANKIKGEADIKKPVPESKAPNEPFILPTDLSKLKDEKFKSEFDQDTDVTIKNIETVNECTKIKNKPGPKSSKKVDLSLEKDEIDINLNKDIEDAPASKSDKDNEVDSEVVKPVLICVDISKLKEKSPEMPKNKTASELEASSNISSPQLIDLAGEDNEESNDIIDIPDSDPLAGTEEVLPIKKVESPKPAAKDFSLATFKLDGSDTADTSLLPEPIARALRNRKISLESVDNRKRSRVQEEISETGGKKPRLRGKRPVDVKLRRSVEQKLAEAGSSSDDNADQDTTNTGSPKTNTSAIRGTGKARRGRARGSGRVESAGKPASNSPSVISDSQSDTSKTDEIVPVPPVIKTPSPRKKRARLLGLDIDPEILNATKIKSDEPPEECGRGSVRQSRRIAQIKIKEEAERRKIEEITLIEIKEDHKNKKHRKDDDKDVRFKLDKKKKKSNMDSDDDSSDDEMAGIDGNKKHKKKKHKNTGKLFNTSNPWQSTSGSSTSHEEEEEEEVEDEPSDEEAILRSDHEFSPESDLETAEAQPLRRARTVKKESDTEDPSDEHACQKCEKADHPEWILLCDKCDCGWHCSCLRPALLVIPEGDWFCPPCQHTALIDALRNQLVEYDRLAKRKETEVRRKERLAYVGISLDNVLPTKEGGGEEILLARAQESGSDSSESGSSSGSSSGDESEPIYQLRERRTAHSYRFNDYDELINSAIQDDIDAVKGAGNQGRGKDIATIVNAEKEEVQALLEQQQQQQQQQQHQEQPLQEPEVELPPLVVPVYEETPVVEAAEEQSEEDSGEELRVVPKHVGKKKHRKLNSLDISSEDDPVDDDDFKVTSASEEDELDELGSEDSDDIELGRRGKRGSGPIRRSTRARTTRYDRDFINDNSDEEPRKKKTRSIWDESESEESDKSWGKKKRVKKPRSIPTPRTIKKSRKKKKRQDDSDPEAYKNRKPKKPKIIFGGLNDSDDEEVQTRRTRGKKINYIDALGSDTDEDKPVTKKLESEDEYVVNEEDDEEAAEPIGNKDSDSESASENLIRPPLHVPKTVLMFKSPSRGRGRGKGGMHRPLHLTPDPSLGTEPKSLDVLSRDMLVANQHMSQKMDIPVIAANPDDLNEEEVGMMMENEEYAKKQLELMAIQLAKEKKRKEIEALKIVPPLVIPVQPKKRGRKKKVDIEAAAAAALLAQEQNITPVAVNTSLISQSPTTPMTISPNLRYDDYSSTEVSPTVPTTIGDLTPSPPKRRGRGKAQTFTTAANSMNQKYFGGMPLDQPRGVPPGQFTMSNRGRVPSPYRQSPPGMNLYPGIRPTAPNSPHRLRSPGPPNMPQMFHSTHHSLDPSPSGGGPINISNRDRSSPAIALPPASSPMGKDGPTPPPPPYSRGPLTGSRFAPGESSPGPSLPPSIRHHLPFPQSGTHLQQPSPPPRPPVPGNFSPYHPPPPPNYHYGAYPPAPSLAAADDALPPTDYQGSPYPEHFNTGEMAIHSSEGSNSKPFDEEGSGEFGGLVSYFSSQREDDLDT